MARKKKVLPGAGPCYLFKIIHPQPATIHYRLIRAPSSISGRLARWLSNIQIR